MITNSLRRFGVCLILVLVAAEISARADTGGVGKSLVGGSYCSERGPHSRVVQNVMVATNAQGVTVLRTNSYNEIATGLCVFDSGANAWVDASPVIDAVADGASATHTQHKVHWTTEVNTQGGAVRLTSPGGSTFSSGVYGLSYWDAASGSNVMIATLTNSQGILVGDNQVVYPGALTGDGFSSDILYTEALAGMEQNILIRQSLPPPSSWGLSDDTSLLEVLTEFTSCPEAVNVVTNDADGVEDDVFISFHDMGIGVGEAFLTQTDGGIASAGKVGKQWLTLDGRQFLVEQIDYKTIAPLLAELPQHASIDKSLKRISRMAALKERPVGATPKSVNAPMKMAKNYSEKPGLVVDYTIYSTSTLSNTTFLGNATYYISGTVTLSGTNTMEGGAALKFTNGASIIQSPTGSPQLNFQTSSYRPVVFTSKDDDSIGQPITGSTTNPKTNYYANPALEIISNSPAITNIRVMYASQALNVSVGSPTLMDAQFVHCSNAVTASSGTVTFKNALFASVPNAFNSLGSSTAIVGENVTFDRVTNLATFSSTNGCSLTFTNCIFSSVTNLTPTNYTVFGGDFNGFYSTTNFGSDTIPLSSPLFQQVGGGGYYLASGSGCANAGTTNVDAALIADLARKTTYPPLVYSNITFSNVTTFFPQAQRDTDTPDLGWHYDVLDHVFGGCTGSNTLTFDTGTAVGWFHEPSGSLAGQGLHLADTQQVFFQGTATALDYWVRANTVQEGGYGPWDGGLAGTSGMTGAASVFANQPTANLTFTYCSVMGNSGREGHLRDQNGYLLYVLNGCQFYGGFIGSINASACITNCLFAESGMGSGNSPLDANTYYYMRNCTVKGALVSVGEYSSFRDNALDGATYQTFSSPPVDFMNNGYLNGAAQLTPAGSNSVTVTNFAWAIGPLGNYYQPVTNLINMGSRTADLAGLYHYTVQTNLNGSGREIKETNSVVDIGFHYVATDSSGNPLDSNGDGIPDYLEDANGNGLVDSSELDWVNAGDLGLTVIITQPANNSQIP